MSDTIVGFYYLHTNGSLIYRPGSDSAANIRESPFARAMWACIPDDRERAWQMLVEAKALDANAARIKELADKWHCDDVDAQVYAERVGCELYMDGDSWCATDRHFVNLQKSPAGFGNTCLEAMAALCKELGYIGGKTWSAHFSDLLNKRENGQFGVGA